MNILLEKWEQFFPDCLELFAEHESEIGDNTDKMPLDPALETWAMMDQVGVLQICAARDDNNKLVGYCLFTLSNSLKSKNILCAEQKLWFVTKAARKGGVGIKLCLESIARLKARGVQNIYLHRWMTGDSAALEKFFLKLGAVELERQYSLWIGE